MVRGNIIVWQIIGLDGLLPLVLFTEDGKQAEVLDEVLERLAATHDKELKIGLSSICMCVYSHAGQVE
jgi:hypothetical protein